jgi:hypothetical protein
MNRIKLKKELDLTSGSALSSKTTMIAFCWFTIEVPAAEVAKAITIQTYSNITSDWRDVVTLSDVTNAFKALTAAELAVVGPLEEIRLKLASNAAATSKVYLHCTS